MTDREAFDDMMALHVARLMDYARPFVGRLSSYDSSKLINDAIEIAWETSGAFNPETVQMLQWWGECLRRAALRRQAWEIREGETYRWISGRDLGWRS